MKVSSGVIFSCAGFSPFAYVGFFPLMILACEMSNPGGGGVEDDMIFIARTVILL